MNLVASAIRAVESLPVPDPILRAGIAMLVERTSSELRRSDDDAEVAFAAAMAARPIAIHPEAANAQHYELPPDFFRLILGPRRKYSSCLFEADDTLAVAEERALAATADHAGLKDGQRILELGCGWGSLSLWMAEHYPAAEIVAVSNSRPQRLHIEAEAARRGFGNLKIVTADINGFEPGERFDRIVSVEMFEHVANWVALLERIHGWLEPQGALFLHVFSHRAKPYWFDHAREEDWIAQHFFTGGIMPSHGLIRRLSAPFAVEEEWRWNGTHYRRTAEHWLANFDRERRPIGRILAEVYGEDAALWRRRWRLFFLATAGLFGASDGTEWGVSHYRLTPR